MDLAVTALRIAASLAAVVGLVWLISRAASRRGARSGLDTSRFTVVGRHSLGRSSGVTVLRVGDEALVLGVTEQSVQLLARTPLSAISDPVGVAPVPAPREGGGDPADLDRPEARRRVLSTTAGPAGAGRSRVALAGSALSPATWTQALDVIRERTTRR